MSEKGFGVRPDNLQSDPSAIAFQLLDQIGQDLAEANREVRLAKGMMDQATKDNDPEALANWEKRFTAGKERADMLAKKLAEQVAENSKLKKYIKSEIQS